MCRSTQSPALLSDEVTDDFATGHLRSVAWPLVMNGRRNQPFADEAVNGAWLIEGNQASDRLAVIGHRHLLPVTYSTEIAAEVVSEFSYSGFHGTSMALLCTEI